MSASFTEDDFLLIPIGESSVEELYAGKEIIIHFDDFSLMRIDVDSGYSESLEDSIEFRDTFKFDPWKIEMAPDLKTEISEQAPFVMNVRILNVDDTRSMRATFGDLPHCKSRED